MLFETYLPTRYYLPREDVRMDLLEPTDTRTACAYKGSRHYWSANVDGTVVADVAWSYEDPHNYATAVEGMLASSTSESTSASTASGSNGRTAVVVTSSRGSGAGEVGGPRR